MFKKNKINQRGIVALFPAIIVSSILLILCVSVSQAFLAFLYRTTIFDHKIQSQISAQSCLSRILAKQNQDAVIITGDVFLINDIPCVIEVTSTTTQATTKIGEAVSVR